MPGRLLRDARAYSICASLYLWGGAVGEPCPRTLDEQVGGDLLLIEQPFASLHQQLATLINEGKIRCDVNQGRANNLLHISPSFCPSSALWIFGAPGSMTLISQPRS